jgi:uncharacterized membrane protein YdjX (TVP38/TMEM64 family)
MGGTIIALGLARRYGRPLVERLVPSRTLDRIDHHARHRGPFFFLLLFLAPFTPNDVVCFLGGLTPIPLPMLMLVAAIGRFPGVLAANLIGANVARLTSLQLLSIGLPASIAILTLSLHQKRLEKPLLRLLKHLDKLLRG